MLASGELCEMKSTTPSIGKGKKKVSFQQTDTSIYLKIFENTGIIDLNGYSSLIVFFFKTISARVDGGIEELVEELFMGLYKHLRFLSNFIH